MTGPRRGFALLIAVLVVTHVWAPHGGPEPIAFGLPWDVLVHLCWMAAAGAAVAWMTSPSLWPETLADPPKGATGAKGTKGDPP